MKHAHKTKHKLINPLKKEKSINQSIILGDTTGSTHSLPVAANRSGVDRKGRIRAL